MVVRITTGWAKRTGRRRPWIHSHVSGVSKLKRRRCSTIARSTKHSPTRPKERRPLPKDRGFVFLKCHRLIWVYPGWLQEVQAGVRRCAGHEFSHCPWLVTSFTQSWRSAHPDQEQQSLQDHGLLRITAVQHLFHEAVTKPTTYANSFKIHKIRAKMRELICNLVSGCDLRRCAP